MRDERLSHRIMLHQDQSDCARWLANEAKTSVQAVVAGFVPGRQERATILAQAHALAPRQPDGGRPPIGETVWSLIAAGLRDTMRQSLVSVTQLDLLGTDELIERTWPAFIEATERECGLLAPANDTGAVFVPGEPFGFDGRVVLRGDEEMTRHGPMPKLTPTAARDGGAA